MLLAPPLFVLLQENLGLLLRLPQELQLHQFSLSFILEGPERLQLLLLGLLPPLALLALLMPLQLQVLVEGCLPIHVQPDSCLNGYGWMTDEVVCN